MILLLGVWFLLGICLHGAVAKSHIRTVVEFGHGHITTNVLFLEQVRLVHCRELGEHVYLEICIHNEEITNGKLREEVTFVLYAPTAVLSSIFSDGRGIFRRGELNLQMVQSNNFIDLTYAGSLYGYTSTQIDGFRQVVFSSLPSTSFFFGRAISGNVREVRVI